MPVPVLAKLRQRNCKENEAGLAQALHGSWRAEHLFALRQALELYRYYQAKRHECDQQIEAQLKTFPDKSGGQQPPPRPAVNSTGSATAPRPAVSARK